MVVQSNRGLMLPRSEKVLSSPSSRNERTAGFGYRREGSERPILGHHGEGEGGRNRPILDVYAVKGKIIAARPISDNLVL